MDFLLTRYGFGVQCLHPFSRFLLSLYDVAFNSATNGLDMMSMRHEVVDFFIYLSKNYYILHSNLEILTVVEMDVSFIAVVLS